MSAQDVLLIIGIVLIVVAVALVGVAFWVYRALDIKGVRDDLSGVARAREVESSRSGGTGRSSARAFSSASWHGAVRRSSVETDAQTTVPDDVPHAPRPAPTPSWVAAPQAAAPPGGPAPHPPADPGDARTTMLSEDPGEAPTSLLDEDDAGTTLLDTSPAPAERRGSFEFRVVRSEMGAGSSRRIEE